MPLTDLISWYLDDGGVLRRWMRGGGGGTNPVDTVPSIPRNVVATIAGTTATVTWEVPLSDGGSPITGYTVKQVGGPTQNLAATIRSTTFTGMVAGTTYTFSVQAANDIGLSQAASDAVSTNVPSSSAPRFPGDTRSKVTGKWLFGLDEIDKDPETIGGTEYVAPETTAKVRVAGMRYYYTSGWTIFDVPTAALPNRYGPIATNIRTQNAKGRIAWPSVNVYNLGVNWDTIADGTHNSKIDDWIAWVEESGTAPVPFAWNHEPNFHATTVGQRAQDWGTVNKWFRSRMDAYANANGGVGVYKWRQLSFGPIHMAQDYASLTSHGPVQYGWEAACTHTASASSTTNAFTVTRHFMSNGRRVKLQSPPTGFNATTLYWVVNATANTFQLATSRNGTPVSVGANATGVKIINNDVWDWMGADPYIGSYQKISSTWWTTNFQKTLAWCEDPLHPYPLGIGEWGIWHRDPEAGPRIKLWVDRCLDGTHDIWAANYFNSNATSENIQWNLDNVNNGNLFDTWVSILKGTQSVRFWDLTRPDGTRYVKPPGAAF